MKRFALAVLGLFVALAPAPAFAGGGRASAQVQSFQAVPSCQGAAAAGGYCPAQAASAQAGYGYQVIQQQVPVVQYQTVQRVQRVVTVPVQQDVAVMSYDVPVVQQQVIQQAAPAYVQQSSAAVGYGASATAAVTAPAAVVAPRARLFRGGLLGRRGVTKSKTVTRN